MSLSPLGSAPTERRSRRKRRAVGLGALAVIVIAAASVAYLHPTLTSKPKTAPTELPGLLVTRDLVSYVFVTPSVGWAVKAPAGQLGVYRTTDGAKHWQRQLYLESSFTGLVPTSVQFLDETHGFVVVGRPFQELNRTTDGGATWDSIPLSSDRDVTITFTDVMHGWRLEASTSAQFNLYATHDAGDSWQRLPDPPPDADSLSLRRATEAWMGSTGLGQPHVYTSVDMGQSWQRHDVPPRPGASWDGGTYFPAGIDLLPEEGVVVSIPPLITQPFPTLFGFEFTSFDAGTTWKYVQSRPGEVAFQDVFHWWAIQQRTLSKSSDAGQTWTQVTNKLPDWPYYIPHVLDSNHAWALLFVVGGYGLAVTSDGGLHWTRVAVPQEPTAFISQS